MDVLTADEYRLIPYVLDVRAVQGDDGDWVCRVEYEELPDCVAEAPRILDALAQVEALREQCIERAVAEDRPLPVPRAPLRA
jgi:predicted RNase H-like HicB family nuclease